MDDHFWPTLYPALAVGLLLGLAGGSVVSTALGSIGELIGATVAYFAFAWLGLEDSVVAFPGVIGGSAIGAYLVISAGKRIFKPGSDPAK